MSLQGRWLTGPRGAERVVKLSSELNRKSLLRARAETKREFAEYRPWMSCDSRRTVFASCEFVSAEAARGAVITDKATLNFLDQAFSSSSDLPLAYLGISEANGLCVETRDWARVERIRVLVRDGLGWLRRVDDSFVPRVDGLMMEIIPLGMRPPLVKRSPLGRGVSSHFYRGGILVDLPEIGEHLEVELAINLAHELGHQALMVYQNADPIIDGDIRAPVYSTIREENRPAIKSLHAVVALAFMKEFVSAAARDSSAPGARRARLASRGGEIDAHLRRGIGAFREAGVKFTELGDGLLAECESALELAL